MRGLHKIRAIMLLGAGLSLLGLGGCAEGKKLSLGRGEQRQQLEERLQILQRDWEILQKDHPPQNDTVSFRLAMNRAEQDLAEKKLRPAEADLAEGEAWMKDARPRYYQQHKADVLGKATQEDGESLLAQAQEFWKKAEAAAAGGRVQERDQYRTAALEEAQLAVLAYAGEREHIYDYARMSLALADFYRRAGLASEAKAAAAEGLRALQEAIADLMNEINRALAGQEEGYKPEQVQKSPEAFDAAGTELERKNQRLLALAERGSGLYPGQVKAEDQSSRVKEWAGLYQQYFQALAEKDQLKTPISDKERMARRERERMQKVGILNEVCKNAVPLPKSFGLQISESLIEPRGSQIVVKGRVINNTGESIFKLQMAVCGEIVATGLIDLNKPTLLNDNQEGFVLPLPDFEQGDFIYHGLSIGPHQLMLIYTDADNKEHREYAEIP
jgi:hypothetical protein